MIFDGNVSSVYVGEKRVRSIVFDDTGEVLYQGLIVPTLSLSSSNVVYGSNVVLSGTSDIPSGEDILIYQGNTLIDTVNTDSNGAFSKTVTGLNAGAYTFKATYGGNSNYDVGESNTVNVTVSKATPTLTLSSSSDFVNQNGTITLTSNLSVGSGESITIYEYLDGALNNTYNETTGANGINTKTLTLSAKGDYSYVVSYGGNSNYNNAFSSTVNVRCGKLTSVLSIEVPALVYSDVFDVTGSLVDENDNAIAGASVKLIRDGSILEATETTDSNGEVTFNRNAPTEITTYSFQLVYDGDSTYDNSSSSSVSRTVSKETSVLTLTTPTNNTRVTPSDTISISGSLSDNDGEELTSQSILVKNGNTTITTLTTTSDGSFTGSINASILSIGNNTLTFQFAENTYYTEATQNITITVSDVVSIPNSLTLSADKNVVATYNNFRDWSGTFLTGSDTYPYIITLVNNDTVLDSNIIPNEFTLNYKFKTIGTSTSSSTSGLFCIGTDANNGLLIGHEVDSRRIRVYSRSSGSNTLLNTITNVFTAEEWVDASITYQNNILSLTINNETISYSCNNASYIGVYNYYDQCKFAEFELIDLSDDSVVSSSKDTSIISALVVDENDNPCANESVIFDNGLNTYTSTTDSNGIATYNYECYGRGDVTITATLNNLTDSINIEDCLYENDGTSLKGLRIQSGVSCTNSDGYIVISKNSSGEQFVYPPVCFTGTDNWEESLKFNRDNYSSQAIAIQMENCNTWTYSGDSAYISYSGSFNNCMGAGNKNASYTNNDTFRLRRLNGYWRFLVNDTEFGSVSKSWSNNRHPGWYTNNGRRQSIKDVRIKKLTSSGITLSADNSRVDVYTNQSATLSATVTMYDTPVTNATVTFKQGNTVLGTATTNSSGVATYTFTPSTTDNYTLTAEWNNNVSSNLNIVAYDSSQALFQDPCTSDLTSQYTRCVVEGGSPHSLTFDTDKYTFTINGSKNTALVSNFEVPTNCIIECDYYHSSNDGGQGIGFSKIQDTGKASYNGLCLFKGDTSWYGYNNQSWNTETYTNVSYSTINLTNKWVHIKMTKTGNSIAINITDPDNNAFNWTRSLSSFVQGSGVYLSIFTGSCSGSYIKNIVVTE